MRHPASPQAPSTWKGRPGTLRGAAEATREKRKNTPLIWIASTSAGKNRKKPVRGPSEDHRDADSQAAHVWWEISASHTHTAT